MSPVIEGFRALAAALERAGVPYCVCGSLASSLYGSPRTTMDVDLVADLGAAHIPAIVAGLGAGFYADERQMREAVARGRAFNLIHYASGYKFDVFPLAPGAYDREAFERRRPHKLFSSAAEAVVAPVASPEDTVLAKLLWYRAGGEVSERQWLDVTGVLAVQRGRLDAAYLERWAARLGVADLLARALAAAR
jgi:hypothetical protein